ncbi:hypothetical protein AXG93_1615s1550 [Marchantia polymorpha subsp. ruderalis]|uniref:Uncharacterized protein n=1 Tax=Marchantia polymorpha subsp. ruderalis TaxID=1480154 RepID=A0A176VVV6_MARPO|nr:hypothetical protein AXG93_1615s1550 [Marchantia polymorpha subsp. ruderalis]
MAEVARKYRYLIHNPERITDAEISCNPVMASVLEPVQITSAAIGKSLLDEWYLRGRTSHGLDGSRVPEDEPVAASIVMYTVLQIRDRTGPLLAQCWFMSRSLCAKGGIFSRFPHSHLVRRERPGEENRSTKTKDLGLDPKPLLSFPMESGSTGAVRHIEERPTG